MANAHFLRGILSESWHCGFDVLALEPADNWSAANLVQDHGPAALAARPIAMRSISQPDLFTYITVLTSSAGAGAVPWRMPTWSSPAPYVPEGIGVSPLVQSIGSRVVAFYDIDTPVTLASLANGDRSYINAELVAGFDLYLSFTGGRALQVLECRYGVRAARVLYCSVDPDPHTPISRGTGLGYGISRHLQCRPPAGP
jgi:spore maturation protein CgeB